MIGPFQLILKVLADLERDGTKFAFPAARLVSLYRRLWESCVSKHIDGQKLEQSNHVLKEAGTHLTKKKREGRSSAAPRQAAASAALFRAGTGIISGKTD